MSRFMRKANCPTHHTIPVACEAIPVERDAANLPLSGVVHVHVQLIIIKKYINIGILSGSKSIRMLLCQ